MNRSFPRRFRPSPRCRQSGTCSPRAAFTLLELMLALSLMAVTLLAVNMAVNLHLRLFESRRSYLEESQLAREILRLIADDIRSATVPYEQDVSALSQMLGTSGGNRGSSSGGSSGGSSTGGDSAGSPSEGESASAGGTGETDMSSESADPFSDMAASEYTQELASLVALPSSPGIFGNQYELQIDVSRLPREDEFYPVVPTTGVTTLMDIPSDIKTVTYYVLNTGTTVTTPQPELAVADLSQATDPTIAARGLVRRQLDRCVTEWALNNGNATALAQKGEVIAPEAIGIEFLYFDGLEWRTDWDSEAAGTLPAAIQILLIFGDQSALELGSASSTSLAGDMAGVRYYRAIVNLPMATPTATTLTEEAMLGL